MHDHKKQKRGIKKRFLALKRERIGVFRLINEEVMKQNIVHKSFSKKIIFSLKNDNFHKFALKTRHNFSETQYFLMRFFAML